MPLSEREQQILAELEKDLYQEERASARGGVRTEPRKALSKPLDVKLGASVFLLGIAALVVFFVSQMVVMGVVAFGAMVTGIVLLVSALRSAIGTRQSEGGDGASAFRDLEDRLRQRYRRR